MIRLFFEVVIFEFGGGCGLLFNIISGKGFFDRGIYLEFFYFGSF